MTVFVISEQMQQKDKNVRLNLLKKPVGKNQCLQNRGKIIHHTLFTSCKSSLLIEIKHP